jgi:hypothetical protein
MVGFAEELEFIDSLPDSEFQNITAKEDLIGILLKGVQATCDFYIANTASDGIPYWDTGAPGLDHLGDYLNQPANPYNDYEPVDSSAAAIGAQGLLRLGNYLTSKGKAEAGRRYWQAGLTVVSRLLETPYLSVDSAHHGLLLHSVYHRPNGWDNIPQGYKVPCNESSMWGDYHFREVALYLSRIISGDRYYTFFNGIH